MVANLPTNGKVPGSIQGSASVWVMELGKSELYSKLLGAVNRCSTAAKQQISYVRRSEKGIDSLTVPTLSLPTT